MKISDSAEMLIGSLLADPVGFDKQGAEYYLLQWYLRGYPVETLRPLLTHQAELVRCAATFIASEISDRAAVLLDCIAPLVHDVNLHTRWWALEAVMVCSKGGKACYFVHVIDQLTSDNASIRRLAMRLVSRADAERLEAGIIACSSLAKFGAIHGQGLQFLLNVESGSAIPAIAAMIDSPEALTRKYGAIAAVRMFDICQDPAFYASSSKDDDVMRFSQEFIDRRRDRMERIRIRNERREGWLPEETGEGEVKADG